MISIIDFVKAFNTDLNYRIVVHAEESGDPFTRIYSNKNEFLEKVQNTSWLDKYYFKDADFNFEYVLDEDTQKTNIVKDKYILHICVKTLRHERNLKLPIKLDDFTINDLKDFEKELNRNNYRTNKYKISNVISENNIVKSFNVEKCEWNLKDLKTVFCMA